MQNFKKLTEVSHEDAWSDCCDYLKQEGWGDVGLLREEKPEEYESIYVCFKGLYAKFKSDPAYFKGSGALVGIGLFPERAASLLFMYQFIRQYEPGNVYRRALIYEALQSFKKEGQEGIGRSWGETNKLATELLFYPRSELEKQERFHRPDGAYSAMSRAGAKFKTDVWDNWQQLTGVSPWFMGVLQFFIWRLGKDGEEEYKFAREVFKYLEAQFNEAASIFIDEINQYGVPSVDEMRVWQLQYCSNNPKGRVPRAEHVGEWIGGDMVLS